MNRILILCCFIAMIWQAAFGQGTRVDTSFYSQALDAEKMVDVYLPEGYSPDNDDYYPTIYFLHGAGGNQNSYPEIIDILDTLIANEHIKPCIVVKPSGYVLPYAGSMWTNSELYGDYEDFVIYDLIEFIETTYKAIPEREYRSITGHSMGGIGCMKIALAHPELYRAVAALSGALDLNVGIDLWLPHLYSENGENPPYNFSPFGGTFSLLTFTAAGAFSPNLSNLPYFVDFPLDENGDVVQSVFELWLPHNPANMASSLPPESDLAIYFDCGTYDHLEFYPMATSFADTLTNLGIDYQFQSFSGDHYSETRPPIAFMFLDSVVNQATGIDGRVEVSLPGDIRLSQNYPNPFNVTTNIEFEIARSGNVKLEIYDILGRLISTPLDFGFTAGTHKYTWDGGDYPSGLYFYKLTGESKTLTSKMTLLK